MGSRVGEFTVASGGGIVDASIVLQVLMHQPGIDASSRENQAGIDASLVTGTFVFIERESG